MTHPTQHELNQYARFALAEDEADAIHEHLSECHVCADSVLAMEQTVIQQLGLRTLDNGAPQDDAINADSGEFPSEVQCERMVAAICDPRFDFVQPEELLPRDLGNYRLHTKLGQGGMGVVYQATHKKLQREVAVKLLKTHRLSNRRAVDRFQREMIAAGRLEHKHVVRALDAGDVDGTHYMVMELLDGANVSELSRGRQLGVAEACEIVRQAALGAHAAHESQLIHRDIKPSNLLVTRGNPGESESADVKLLDLGLAMFGSGLDPVTELSMSGQLLGTLAYMAPEQVRDSSEVDHRADVYSLAATLFKLLCGKSPLDVASESSGHRSLLSRLQGNTPSIRSQRKGLPTALVSVIDKALHQDVGHRYQSAADLAAALLPFCQGASLSQLFEPSNDFQESESLEASTTHVWRRVLVAAGLIGVGAVLATLAFNHWQIPPALRFDTAVAVTELNSPYVDDISAISHDGLHVILQSTRNGGYQSQLYSASRDRATALFSRPAADEWADVNESSFNIRSGLISPAGKEAFYFTDDGDFGGRKTFFRTVRENQSVPFPAGEFLEQASLAPYGSGCFHRPQWISTDGLRLYYTFEKSDNKKIKEAGARWLYLLDRPSLNDDFGGRKTFFRTVRENQDALFPAGEFLEQASLAPYGSGCLHRPQWISPDGLRLYYTFEKSDNKKIKEAGARRLYLLARPSLNDDFGAPSESLFAALNDEKVNDASLSADELELFFSSDRPGGRGKSDIWYARRKSLSEPFQNPINVRRLNTSDEELVPKIFGDTLFFSRGNEQDRDIYSAQRGDLDDSTRVNVPVFSEAAPIAALNSPFNDYPLFVSADECTIVLGTQRETGYAHKMRVATRPSVDVEFSEPAESFVTELNAGGYNVNSGVVSPDGREIFYSSVDKIHGRESFFRAVRNRLDQPFSDATLVKETSLAPDGAYCMPYPQWLSADGLRLYFVFRQVPDAPSKAAEPLGWYVAERSAIDAKFGRPSKDVFRNIQTLGSGGLSADELEFYCSSPQPGGEGESDIWYSSRSSISDPFPPLMNLVSVNTSDAETGPCIVGDTLYFARGPSDDTDIYSAQRLPQRP